MALISTPHAHPGHAPRGVLPIIRPAPATWSPWYPVAEMLDAGDLDIPAVPGVYAFRIQPELGVVPDWAPTRLIYIGGAGETGSLFQRIGNFIAAGLGRGQLPAPQHSGGQKFGEYRVSEPWQVQQRLITVRDLDVAFMESPPGQPECAEAATWTWLWNTYMHTIPGLAAGNQYPACSSQGHFTCQHGQSAQHPWYQAPPAP